MFSQMFGPSINMWRQIKQSGDQLQSVPMMNQLRSNLDATLKKLKNKGMDVSQYEGGNIDQIMPQLEAMYEASIMSIPTLQKLSEIAATGRNQLNVTGLAGEYDLERQRLANQGAKDIARIKATEEGDSELADPKKVVGRVLLRLGKNQTVTDDELSLARGYIEQDWLNRHRLNVINMGFLNGYRGQALENYVDRTMIKELKKNYPKLYQNVQEPADIKQIGTESKSVGDIVEKGGKKWRITGFDSDGEPLVEPVK